MSSTVRRAIGFAFVGSIALLVPVFVELDRFSSLVESVPIASILSHSHAMTVLVSVPFLAVTLLSLITSHGPLFDLFAFPGDYEEGRLYGLASFCLAAAGLTVVTLQFGMPIAVFIASVLLLVYGNLAEKLTTEWTDDSFMLVTVFVTAAFIAGLLAQGLTTVVTGESFDVPLAVFLASSGALMAALLRSVLFDRDDPLVMLTVAFALWLFADLLPSLDPMTVISALIITIVFGYLSYALETASVTGMLSGVLLSLLTIVLGSYGWFAVLISFFMVGGLATKFRYDTKRSRGLAEDNEGARGSGNVLANSAVALVAVIGSAASDPLGVPETLFLFAFTGAIAAAMSDTLSSEIGGLYDNPRLITTLEPVPPGTDGGVTWQGELAGVVGAGIVAGIAVAFFDLSALGVSVIVVAGIAGMTTDSLLGATMEGVVLDNMAVNFLATLVASIVAIALSLATSVVVL
ncbi:DUF92 domain-containing protein [Halocatena marina]|uniref:DUF92 domain-containing protein n=1 Tax=Halocatena marina TaxID=2934937 RepID=UPI00200C22E5|nr:DUF92 domain-containing protein [Halocatena marina]